MTTYEYLEAAQKALTEAIEQETKRKREDAAKIVRCKDCLYWDGEDGCFHNFGLNLTSSDCFCSWGQRRKKDNG